MASAILASCGNTNVRSDGQPPAPAADICSGNDIVTIERPYFPDSDHSETFSYHFQHVKRSDPTKPTIVFIPGGPGGGSIGQHTQAFPGEFNVIYTDPRGVACNEVKDKNLPDQFYRTQYLASDILAIVKTLDLKNYYIYGVSYGSLLGTVTASLGEAQGIQKPNAIILEGILGRAFENRQELYGTYASVWKKIKADLPPGTVDALSKNPLPFDASEEAWGASLSSMMIVGAIPGLGHFADAYLRYLDGANADNTAKLKSFVASMDKTSPASERKMYRLIACHEIAAVANDNHELLLKAGELVAKDGDICGTDGFNSDKFDAKKWSVTTPIYYFQGDLDPSTPVWQARYNYDSQVKASRTFVTVINGGHGAFEYGMTDCGPDVIRAIDGGGSALTQALSKCTLKTTIEMKTPAVPNQY